MTDVSVFLWALILCLVLCALYIAPKAVAPFVQRLQGLAGDSDSLRTSIFPSLAFSALCAIILKLSVF